MSVLLVGLPEGFVEALIRVLLAQGDEVRLLTTDDGSRRRADPALHVATGPSLADPDLVERAAQNVRTVVIGGEVDADELSAVIEGSRAAGVSRLVLCARRVSAAAATELRSCGVDYAVLELGKRRLRGAKVSYEAAAEAVDAADDLAGEVRLELDLTQPGDWGSLRLEPPRGS